MSGAASRLPLDKTVTEDLPIIKPEVTTSASAKAPFSGALFNLLYGGLNVLGLGLTARDALLRMAPPVVLVLLVILLRIRQARQL